MLARSSPDILKLEAQEVLDEVCRHRLNSFKLTALKVEWIGVDKYKVYFHDGRVPAVTVSCASGKSFRDVFRSAMLAQVSKLD